MGHNWEIVVLLFIEADTLPLSAVGKSSVTGSCELSLLVKMKASNTMSCCRVQ